MPGGGGISSRLTKVILKNKWGLTIGESNENCSIFYDGIKITWDIKNKEVYYGVARSINLQTGKCAC